jgi:hypothetical protein
VIPSSYSSSSSSSTGPLVRQQMLTEKAAIFLRNDLKTHNFSGPNTTFEDEYDDEDEYECAVDADNFTPGVAAGR